MKHLCEETVQGRGVCLGLGSAELSHCSNSAQGLVSMPANALTLSRESPEKAPGQGRGGREEPCRLFQGCAKRALVDQVKGGAQRNEMLHFLQPEA